MSIGQISHSENTTTWQYRRVYHSLLPPKVIFFPKLDGPSEDVDVIKTCLAGLGLLDLPPKEHAVTFPIGSYCHQLILGTRVGDQVGRLFYQHKAKLPACSVVAIHIWDSGINAAPAVLFSTQAYHEDVETIAIQNRAFEENGANIRCGDWPVKLKPQWIPASNQGTGVVASGSGSEASAAAVATIEPRSSPSYNTSGI